MTDIDEIRRNLGRLADRGQQRGARAVFDGARTDARGTQRRRRQLVRVAAAACLLLATGATWVLWPTTKAQDNAKVGSRSIRTPDARSTLPPLHVAGSNPVVLGVAFDRIWVGTSAPAQLQSFDRRTGAHLASINMGGPPFALAATENAVYVRVSLRCAPTEPCAAPPPLNDCSPGADCTRPTNMLLELNPLDGAVISNIGLDGDGPLAVAHDRVAVADFFQLRLFAGDGTMLAVRPIQEVVGQPTPPGTNAFTSLSFAADGTLVGYHEGLKLLVRLDGSTGQRVGPGLDLSGQAQTQAVVGSGRAWVLSQESGQDLLRSASLDRDLGRLTSVPADKVTIAYRPLSTTAVGRDRLVLTLVDGRAWVFSAVTGRFTQVGDMADAGSTCRQIVTGGDEAWYSDAVPCTGATSDVTFTPLP